MTPDTGSTLPPPLILLAHRDETFARALESVLTEGDYRVVTVESEAQVMQQARRRRPDGIILDIGLTDPHGFSVCRALRADPAVSMATPIVLTTRGPVTRAQRLDALRAGAWELRGDPLDTEDLLLRLAVYVRGKIEVERLGTEGLIDRASGLYNAAGMTRRSEELAALTARQGLALACAVFRATDEAGGAGGGTQNGTDGDRLAVAFKQAGRISDAIGRTGPMEFAVFAPATDEPAAARLVTRLADSVSRAIKGSTPVSLRAGYSAAAAEPRVDPVELLARARTALDTSPPRPSENA